MHKLSHIQVPVASRLASLNKAKLFTVKVPVAAIRIAKDSTAAALKALPLFKIPRKQSVVPDTQPASDNNIVLLSTHENVDTLVFFKTHSLELFTYTVTLDYAYWSVQDILRAILPDVLEVPTSFETIGHIAHLNLRDEYVEYKHIIADVILDKTKNIKTVVNKIDSIHHTYRFFKMEVLAGIDNLVVSNLKESNCLFSFDFSKVYWNSRLQAEHHRLIQTYFAAEHAVCDVMAGIGPFALPAGKRGCLVFANDLNPASHEYLAMNITQNKLAHRVCAFNADGRDFVRLSMGYLNDKTGIRGMFGGADPPSPATTTNSKKRVCGTIKPGIVQAPLVAVEGTVRLFDHYVMNLPATAIEFLDSFKNVYESYHIPDDATMPLIHCYCFSSAGDARADVLGRCSNVLGYTLVDTDVVGFHHVRDVAPRKQMLCVSLRLPRHVMCGGDVGNVSKKARIEVV